jgi:hypothetical protein
MMTPMTNEYFYHAGKEEVSVYRKPEGSSQQIILVAKDVTTPDNAKLLIDQLVTRDVEVAEREAEVNRIYEESLNKVHQFEREAPNSQFCNCGGVADQDIHFVPDGPHIYRPDTSVNTTNDGLCQCGRTKNDPRHKTESEL